MKRPNQIALTLPPALKADVDAIAKADYDENRSALIIDAVRRLIATKKAACSKCGRHDWIAGYHAAGPLCGDCF